MQVGATEPVQSPRLALWISNLSKDRKTAPVEIKELFVDLVQLALSVRQTGHRPGLGPAVPNLPRCGKTNPDGPLPVCIVGAEGKDTPQGVRKEPSDGMESVLGRLAYSAHESGQLDFEPGEGLLAPGEDGLGPPDRALIR